MYDLIGPLHYLNHQSKLETDWKNEESLQEFMSSSGFATYLQIFFGVDELSQAPPFAFFTLAPGTLLAGEKMIVFTLSYAHPVTPEDRDLYYGGPIGWPRWTRLGLRNQTSWMREPQRLKNGRLVDIAMGVQLWPPEIEVDADTVISEDPFVRMEWDGEVDRITPLSIEEVTWLTWPSAEELKEMDDQQEREGAEYEDDDEDYSEEDDDILISKQLLSEQEHVHVRSESERLLIDPEH